MGVLSTLFVIPLAIFVIGGAEPAYWDWQLTEPLDLSVRVEVLITDMDSVTTAQVADLKTRGVTPICYISVGTSENYRDDAAAFPAAVLGKPLDSWPDEVYVDIRAPVVADIMRARIDRCADMGFAGVEADNIDLHDNDASFPIKEADSVAYISALAEHAHTRGLTIAQKNAPELIPQLVKQMDFLLLEQCFEYDFCEEAKPYLDAGKDVLVVEYSQAGLDWEAICTRANALGLHLLLKDRDITAGGKACTKT